jgi:alcohol dehydrogenase
MAQAHAAVLTEPRKFEIREFAIPEIGPDDAVLKMEAAGLCGTDYEQYAGHLKGTPWDFFPVIPGHEIQGFIDRIGPEASKKWNVKEGDHVVMEAIIGCGQCFHCAVGSPLQCEHAMGYGLYVPSTRPPHLWGGYASHVYVHPRALIHKVPAGIPKKALSLYNPLSSAVRWAGEVPRTSVGDTVVVLGPGQRGLLCAVVALEAGASTVIVTGTKHDKGRLAIARELGVTHTIDVDAENAVERVHEITGGRGADVIVEVSAQATQPIIDGVDMVRRGGTIVLAGLKSFKPVGNLITDKIVIKEIKMVGVLSAGWTSIERALDILRRRHGELERLCTHSVPLAEADHAVKLLGREVDDGREVVHVMLDCTT